MKKEYSKGVSRIRSSTANNLKWLKEELNLSKQEMLKNLHEETLQASEQAERMELVI